MDERFDNLKKSTEQLELRLRELARDFAPLAVDVKALETAMSPMAVEVGALRAAMTPMAVKIKSTGAHLKVVDKRESYNAARWVTKNTEHERALQLLVDHNAATVSGRPSGKRGVSKGTTAGSGQRRAHGPPTHKGGWPA